MKPTLAPLLMSLCALLVSVSAYGQRESSSGKLLRGLDQLHMHVVIESERDVDRDMRNQMADVVELELRRAMIPLLPYVVNEPDENIPLLLVSMAVDRNGPRPVTRINLQIIDRVVVARNKENTTATIYSARTDAASNSDATLARDTRDGLRDLMKRFIEDYNAVNPRR